MDGDELLPLSTRSTLRTLRVSLDKPHYTVSTWSTCIKSLDEATRQLELETDGFDALGIDQDAANGDGSVELRRHADVSPLMAVEPPTLDHEVHEYLNSDSMDPLFLRGDSLQVLKHFPSAVIDCCMTSPPYWGHRQYSRAGIGLETDWRDYVKNLCAITAEVKRVLKPEGSFWLNIGDSYQSKNLLGIPWRVAIEMTENQGWILRNSVIWHKVKGGPDNANDKLRNVYEYVFHFVKESKYFYDADSIRSTPQKARVENGAVISATGVTGVRYRRQIELSTALTDDEKRAAFTSLADILNDVKMGRLADFRMIIRGQQRTTHSDSARVSGRAKELAGKGFYFLKYHPNGSKPKDVWDIIPEDTQGRGSHYAPYPEDLCKIPIMATCPQNGVVLDPFCGTGTTMAVAFRFKRKSIGIDLAPDYIRDARARFGFLR
jgi:site-specific DNA-methyltransferase (adenine-specific)